MSRFRGNISACFASAIFNIHSLPKAARVYFPGTKMPVTLMAHSHGKANKPCGGTSQPLFSIQFGGKKQRNRLYYIKSPKTLALLWTPLTHHLIPPPPPVITNWTFNIQRKGVLHRVYSHIYIIFWVWNFLQNNLCVIFSVVVCMHYAGATMVY